MAKLAFDIYRLYTQAFGAGVGLPFPVIDARENAIVQEGFDGLTVVPGVAVDPPLKGDFNFKSPYGASYHLPVKMGSSPVKTAQYQLPNEPIMSIKGSKMLKVTPIRRGKGRGTVKEERGLNDYQITIRGLAINETSNEYPEAQIKEIRKICESEGVIYITSYLTGLYNVTKVSVKDFDFPRFPGNSMRVQPYVIECISDMDFDDFKRIIDEN